MKKRFVVLFFIAFYSFSGNDVFCCYKDYSKQEIEKINENFIRAVSKRNERAVHDIFKQHAWALTVKTACHCAFEGFKNDYPYPFNKFLNNTSKLREEVRVNVLFIEQVLIKRNTSIFDGIKHFKELIKFPTINFCFFIAVERGWFVSKKLAETYPKFMSKIFFNAVCMGNTIVIAYILINYLDLLSVTRRTVDACYFKAIENRDVQTLICISKILSDGSRNVSHLSGLFHLIRAVVAGDLETVKALLKQNSKDASTSVIDMCYQIAEKKGHHHICQSLLNHPKVTNKTYRKTTQGFRSFFNAVSREFSKFREQLSGDDYIWD